MKNRKKHSSSPEAVERHFPRVAVLVIAVLGALAVLSWKLSVRNAIALEVAESRYQPRPRGQLTFNKDIAPIVFERCTICHRPGQTAPFSFLSYEDVKKHLQDILTVTQERYMPPWLPEPGHGSFVGTRRLTAEQIGVLKQWANEGAPEGDSADLRPPQNYTTEWQLGAPDLVVSMPKSYQLRAEGPDIYRNFVIPISVDRPRWVRAIEFRPGNPKIVHHAFIKLDRTGQCRYFEGEGNQPGFSGFQVPAEMPDGLLLGWQPGRMAAPFPEGMAFRVEPGNDFLLQAHLNSSGKPEELQSSIALYFTDQPPTKKCARIELSSYTIDIPAGATNYVVEDSLVLPVDAQLIAILPHAHYLAREMEGWAERPDGTRESLILIKHWDFNWQTDYRYVEPIDLPKGTRLGMRFIYDNSADNPRNPNHPPKEVGFGSKSTDEMAELWFQLLPKNPADVAVIEAERESEGRRRMFAQYAARLKKNPNDGVALTHMGLYLMPYKKTRPEAERMLRNAVQLIPEDPLAHYNYGLLLRSEKHLVEARREFEKVVQLDPKNSKAHGNLGFIAEDLGDRAGAEAHFEQALRINPFDALAKDALAELRGK